MSPELSKNIAHLFWFFLKTHLFDSGDKRGGFDAEQFRCSTWSINCPIRLAESSHGVVPQMNARMSDSEVPGLNPQ